MEDDPGSCFDESVKQIPELVGADKSVVLAHIRKLYEEMNNSDKENVENKDIKIIESDEPKKVNGIHNSLIEESSNLLLCSADSEKCPVHSVNMKQKWSFFYENHQIDELIESLNERGIRESELKQMIINDREDLISIVNQTPVNNLNPYLQTESESRLRPRRSIGKLKYDNPNFGFAEETDTLTVLQSVLTEKVLEMEANIYSGTIGLLNVKDRDKWREMLRTRDFENFVKTYQIPNEVSNAIKNRKDEGSNSRPATPNIVKEYKDPGQFLSSSLQIDYDDVDYNKLLILSEEHKYAIHALSVALVQVGRALEHQYLRKPLGQTAPKNDKSSKGGLLGKWEQSLLFASSYDQVFLHYATLNKCIFWSRSALLTKCQVCRKQSNAESMILCDSCNKGQHLFCFRPKLKVVPKDSWYCKDCEKEIEKETKLEEVETKTPKWKKIVDPDTSEESENDVEEEVEEEEEHAEEVEEAKAERESKPENETVDISSESDGKEECSTYKIIHSESEEYSEEESGSFDEDDICTKCKTGGTLLCCDECPDMFHVECAEPPLRRVPRGKWFCHHCKLKMAYLLGSRSGSEDGFARRSKRREIDRRDDLPLHNAPLQEVLADVLKHEYAWPFIRPVVKNEVPDYYDIITKPMDFGTIKYKLNMGEYKCDADLMDDAALVFDNCNTYNSTDDEVYHCGVKLLKYFVNKCHERGLKVSPKMENEISCPSKPKKLCVN
ncbi:hypothetical protein RI129_002453 [Pyrocoelia pectoralis]|uniref:Bromodomain adjacent to zinc finger domain protein 1A n=1 Tax=Pyrocoelia pectoralis TaxID=417401 RepID=A0AAN7VLJ0_9COLE